MNPTLRQFLIASLLLNLLLFGIVLGHLWTSVIPLHPTPEEIVAHLPPEQRQQFDQALDKAKADIAPLRAQITQTRQSSLCILSKEPFNKGAYLAKVNQLHALHGQLSQRISKAVSAVANQLSPTARVAFVDMLRPSPPPHATSADCSHQ